jgi:hypothetical protein
MSGQICPDIEWSNAKPFYTKENLFLWPYSMPETV